MKSQVERPFDLIAPMHNIGALSLNTRNLKMQLRHECSQWNMLHSNRLHTQAFERMEGLPRLHEERRDAAASRHVPARAARTSSQLFARAVQLALSHVLRAHPRPPPAPRQARRT